MKPIQLQVAITLDDDALGTLAEVLAQAIERGTARHMQAMERLGEVRPERDKPLPGPVPGEQSAPTKPTPERLPDDKRLLIDTKEVAKLLKLGDRTIWGMSHSGRMPAPIKIGGAVRWNRAEIEAWVAAGCPAVERRGVRRT